MHRATNRSNELLVAASKHAGLSDARGVLWMAGDLAWLPAETRHVELCAEVSRSRAAALQSFATQLLNLRADVLSLVRDELFLAHLERGDVLKKHLDEPVDRAYLARLRQLPRVHGVSGEVVLAAASVVSSCALLLAVSELCPRRRSHLQAWGRWSQAQRVTACASSLGRLVVGAEARPPHWVMVV